MCTSKETNIKRGQYKEGYAANTEHKNVGNNTERGVNQYYENNNLFPKQIYIRYFNEVN